MVLTYFPVLSTERLDRPRGLSTLGGFVYLHRISGPRVAGVPGCNFRMFRELFRKSTLENVVILTNMWDKVSRGIGEARESELINYFFKPAIDKGAQFVRYHFTMQSSAHDIIRRITRNLPTRLGKQQEFVDETAHPGPDERIRRHQDELKAIREEAIKALRDKEELRREFEQEIRNIWKQMSAESEQEICKAREQTRVELERMTAHHDEEERRMKTNMERTAALHYEARMAMKAEMRGMQEEAHLEIRRMAVRHEEEKRRMGTEITALHHGNETRTAVETEIRGMEERARLEIKRLHKQTGGILV